jgi:hypothetical protein
MKHEKCDLMTTHIANVALFFKNFPRSVSPLCLSSGFLAALHFFKQSLYHSAGDISQLRSACVCNDTFGMLAAKHNFHAYIQNLPPNLAKHLKDFVEFAESENSGFAVSF